MQHHIDFSVFSFIVGLVVGCLGTLLASYRFFQTRAGCEQVRSECMRAMRLARDSDLRDIERHDDAISELREMLRETHEELRSELSCVKARLTALIIYSDIPEEKRAEILREGG